MQLPFKNLLSTIEFGGLKSKNRIMKAPQSTWFFEDDFTVGDRILNFYEALAKGGTGIVVVSAVAWTPLNPGGQYGALYDDKYIEGMSKLASVIKKHGSIAICQLHHGGPSAPCDFDGSAPVGSTTLTQEELPYPAPIGSPTKGLSKEDMARDKKKFVEAAIRVKKSGFDAVEFHMAHGYYFESFLSKVWNKRTDEYGPQSIENRTRYVREIMAELKEALGDFPIGVRINGQEWGANNTMIISDSVEIAKILEQAGACYISVTGYGFGSLPWRYLPDYFPYPEPELHMKPYMKDFEDKGLLVPAARAIKQAVKVPVVAVGRMDENKGEQLIAENSCDIVAFGRYLWADPELANKLYENRAEDIVKCTRCATCEDPPFGRPRRCRVNPSMGREAELEIKPTNKPKKVMVIGGGPAGMEAARVATLRGHDVTIYEKDSRLGGYLYLASMIKGSSVENVMPIVDYLTTQVRKLNIKVKTDTFVDMQLIEREKPDVVIAAIGGLYKMPDYPGIKNATGVKDLSKQVKLPLRILGPDKLGRLTNIFLPVGKNIVIIGGQIEGCQGAAFMRKRGRNVTILEEGDSIGKGIPPRYLDRLKVWFEKKNVVVQTKVEIKEITDKGVVIKTAEGHTYLKEADDVIILKSQEPNNDLFNELQKRNIESYLAGSANGAEVGSLIVNALYDGRKIGCSI